MTTTSGNGMWRNTVRVPGIDPGDIWEDVKYSCGCHEHNGIIVYDCQEYPPPVPKTCARRYWEEHKRFPEVP